MDVIIKPTKQELILQDSHGPLVAFIIGVDDYDKSSGFVPLKTCTNDAIEIRNTLQDILQLNADKERVTVLTSKHDPLSRAKILGDLKKAVSNTAANDRFLFYFSGHGHRLKDDPEKFYLVPPDAYADNDPTLLVDFESVLSILKESPAKQKIIILDACFSGPILSGAKSPGVAYSPKFLKEYLGKTHGIIILSSSTGDEESFTQSPDKKTSLFTHFVLRALRGEPQALMPTLWLSVGSLYDYVSMAVQQQAKQYQKKQSPAIDANMDGTILLADFGKVMLPVTNVELGEYPVNEFEISSVSSKLRVKEILTNLWRNYTEAQLQFAANKALPEFMQDDLSEKASQIAKVLDVPETVVTVEDAGIEFPGGSYICEYIAHDKKIGVIQHTLVIESQHFEKVEKIPQLIDAVEIYASEFTVHFKSYFDPLQLIPGLKARGWKVSAHRPDYLMVEQSGYVLTIEPAKIKLSGFAPRELFGSEPDEVKTALAAGVLALIK